MEAGLHFGHASGKWHPKMKPYIFATRDKLHIIDLEQTRQRLTEVMTILEQRIADGKMVVLVGTKKQTSDRIKQIGQATGLPYVDVRWLGGTMTNFAELQKSINRMKRAESFLASDDASQTMIKKERVALEAEVERMEHKYGGLRDMNRKPDAMFIIDPGHEHNAVKEAHGENIELFGIVDTNCNPELVNHVIPANDDAPKGLKIMLDMLEATILSGQAKAAKKRSDTEAAAAKAQEPVAPAAEEVAA